MWGLVSGHLGIGQRLARWRKRRDATLAGHDQVIWLLAERRSCAEVPRLTGLLRRWVEERLARYNRFGPSSRGERRRDSRAKPQILTPAVKALLRERVTPSPDDGGVRSARKVALLIATALGLVQVAEQRG